VLVSVLDAAAVVVTSNDKLRFSLLIRQLFMHWNHAFESGAFDIVDHNNIPGLLAEPGGANWWRRNSTGESVTLNPAFTDFVNQKLEEYQARGSTLELRV
jgi:hypothetical protein